MDRIEHIDSNIDTGVKTITDARGKKISHKIIGQKIFQKARKDYIKNSINMKVDDFIEFLIQYDSSLENIELLAAYLNKLAKDHLYARSATMKLTKNAEKNIQKISKILGNTYYGYMKVSEHALRFFDGRHQCSLNILIETTESEISFTVDYNWAIPYAMNGEDELFHHNLTEKEASSV